MRQSRTLYLVEGRCDGGKVFYHNFQWVYEVDEATRFVNAPQAERLRDYMERQAQRSGDVYGVKVVTTSLARRDD